MTSVVQGDHMAGKLGIVRELDCCLGNILLRKLPVVHLDYITVLQAVAGLVSSF